MGAAPGQLLPHLQLKHLPRPGRRSVKHSVVSQPPHVRTQTRALLPAASADAAERLQKYRSQNKTDGLSRPFYFAAVRAGRRYKQRRSFRFGAVRKAMEGRKRSAAAVHPDVFRVPSRSAFRAVSKKRRADWQRPLNGAGISEIYSVSESASVQRNAGLFDNFTGSSFPETTSIRRWH